MKDDLDPIEIAAVLTACLLMPILRFCLGYVIGLIAKFFLGDIIVNTCLFLNIVITVNDIPTFCALLSFISSFFKD